MPICQLRDAGNLLLHYWFFCLWPADVNEHGGGGVTATKGGGAATGFVGLFAYLGASLAGWPLAKLLDTWHWSGFFVVISIAAGIAHCCYCPFLNAQAPREA
ncbi:hypothetical protein ACLB1R_26325 [Escherichia coli]